MNSEPGDVPDWVLEAAADVMQRLGFERASMRDIAAAAGVSKPGLYYHVTSKEALLYAIHDRFGSWLLDRSEQVLAKDEPADKKFASFVELSFEAIGRYSSYMTVYLHERSHLDGELGAEIERHRARYREICEQILRQGVDEGIFVEGDISLDALIVMGSINWAYVWFDGDGDKSPAELASYFSERLMQGLKPR